MRTKTPEPERAARFEDFYNGQFRSIAAYVHRRIPPTDAPDVVARTFAVAWRRFDHLPPAPHDRLWLYGVARRTVADHLRAARRRARLHARLTHLAPRAVRAAPEGRREGPDSPEALVADAIAALAPAEREVLQLLLWDDLSQGEAAAVLGCSVNAVEIRFRRARRRVGEVLTARGASGLDAAGPGHAKTDTETRALTIPVAPQRRAQQ